MPFIGSLPMSAIGPRDVLAALRKMEARGALDSVHRVKQVTGQVFRYAVAIGAAERDVTQDLKGSLAKAAPSHFAAITEPKPLGDLMRSIFAYGGHPNVVAARCCGVKAAILWECGPVSGACARCSCKRALVLGLEKTNVRRSRKNSVPSLFRNRILSGNRADRALATVQYVGLECSSGRYFIMGTRTFHDSSMFIVGYLHPGRLHQAPLPIQVQLFVGGEEHVCKSRIAREFNEAAVKREVLPVVRCGVACASAHLHLGNSFLQLFYVCSSCVSRQQLT